MRAAILVALLIPATAAARPAPREALTDLRPFGDRVHVARVGASGLSAARMTSDHGEQQVSLWDEQVVVEIRKDAVRIAIDDDDARLLLWIPIADVAWTVARPTRIVGRGETGVWMLPGAPLVIAGAGRRVAATYTDDNLTVHGTIARGALAHVFPATTERGGGPDRHTRAALRRDPAGGALVQSAHGLAVSILDRGAGEWRLVEHRARYLRIVGWVRGTDLEEGTPGTSGYGMSGSFGVSDTQRIEIPAGACLFDPVGGAVVGIQTRTSVRYAGDDGGGRWWVYVRSPWGLRQVAVRDLATDANAPRWQMCR